MDQLSIHQVAFTVYGVAASMKNSKILTITNGKPRSIKSAAAQRFSRDFMLQVPPELRDLKLKDPLRFTCHVFYPDHRADLDAALIADLLQASGVIENDRQLIEQHLYRGVDKAEPRVEIELEVL